jgi:RHS repeat-associated protein
VAWNPGYSTSTNHYTCAGCTYDASGNVTGDSFNTYAWDPYDKLLGVNSTACGTNGECATYDAFGRMVEFSKDATYKENWYTQAGRVTMSGATLSEAYLGAPGGGTFMELGGQNDYLHKDWLGSARIGELISEQTVGVDLAYAPYGEVYNFIAGAGGDWMFTGDVTQLDSEYLFDTPNREFAAKNQGRWLSPDPAGTGWNQYAYATNPNSNIDPSGLACYPLEKQVFGTCAGFLNNGVSFGGNWNEFAVLSIPTVTANSTYIPPSYWMTATYTLDSQGNQIGDPFYTFGVVTGGWQNLGNGLDALNIIAANNSWSPYITAATDVAGIVTAVGGYARLGAANTIISLANDFSLRNIMVTGPGLFPELSVPSAFIGAEADLLNLEVQIVMEGMIEATPGATMDNGYGGQVATPAEMDMCAGLGGIGCP